MSLAATLAASGMRPASFLPTVKCSNCGDEIEISSMGEHTCTSAPASPKAAPPSLNNPFTLRQLNASETKPNLAALVTKPAQPSPLQFNTDENKPPQPSPLQFSAGPSHLPRQRAPTVGSSQLPIPRAPRPAPPKINSDAANQPFLGPVPPTPLSPSSSIRSGSSGSSKTMPPPRRAMTTPMPRIFDPRPPSPELSANLDCAFPPFPASAPTITKRKASIGSQTSSRSGARPEISSAQPRSPSMGTVNSTITARTSQHSRKPSNERNSQHSRRPSNEERSPRDMFSADSRSRQLSGPLTPLEEAPSSQVLMPPRTDMAPLQSPALVSPLSPPQPATASPASLSPNLAFPTPSRTDQTPSPVSPMIPSPRFPPPPTPTEPQAIDRNPSQKRQPPPRPARPDEDLALIERIPSQTREPPPRPSRPDDDLQTIERNPSQKRQPPPRPPRPDEPLPDILTANFYQSVARQPSQKRIPPERPARPEEGLPASLLNPINARSLSTRDPAPFSLQNLDRSQTQPLPSRDTDEFPTSPVLSKMPSEPVLRHTSNTSHPAPFPPQDQNGEDSRVDRRIHDAPPVPKSVQQHRSESLHKSSESGTSTASSILSLGNLSLGNSNTTAEASPVVSAASSLDVFSPDTEKDAEDDDLRVPALNIKPLQKPGLRTDQAKENPYGRMPASPLAGEVVRFDEAQSEDALRSPSLPATPGISHWPLESPMDPALQDGIITDTAEGSSANTTPRDAVEQTLVPNSPKLERLSSAVYDPKRPFSAEPKPEAEPQSRPRSRSNLEPDFGGFNFGSAFSSHLQSDSEPSSRKPSDTPSTTSESTPITDPLAQFPEPPPIPQDPARPPLVRRGTTGARATCRGCSQQIAGKSVKAADGRLTGRWHKACFVCQTCKEAFTTADFYVINNQPYCEQHYHEKNGSVCHGCHRGIEGPFLETQSGRGGSIMRKYHRRCFTCVDCRMVLSEDYFEIAGRVHCERHALAAMRSQARGAPPPGSPAGGLPRSGLRAENFTAERRRTRLMEG